MNLDKEFELYRKLEIILFRYFKIAEFLESCVKIYIKTKDSISTILHPRGYDNSYTRGMERFNETIYIPFNPFYLIESEKQIFLQMFPNKFWKIENKDKEIRNTLLEIWNRIYEIKCWLGIIPIRTIHYYYKGKFIQEKLFYGIKKSSRLTTTLKNYLRTDIKKFRWDFEHAIFRNVSKYTIKKFLNVMKIDKEGIVSIT